MLAAQPGKTRNADLPIGMESRIPWTSSRITGAPEPPPPYKIERIFPKLQFAEPVEFVSVPGSDRIVLVQLRGKIVTFVASPDTDRTDLLVDLKEKYADLSNVYGFAFHPKFRDNHRVYVCYVLKDGDPDGSRVSQFTVTSLTPPRIDPGSEKVLITWLGGGHNGGSIHFGRDSYLYISTGDGKGPDPPDTLDTGQDISDLLSSVLRIDVDHEEAGRKYRIPPDNPFLHTANARAEVWCYGLRNPWRMSFDAETGDLWIGDVGWELWEMIYRGQRGANYGWSVVEGKQVVKPGGKQGPTPIVPPLVMHPHSEAASITGGYVYHGDRLRDLRGAYIYADYETGRIWALRGKSGATASLQEIAHAPIKTACFGIDPAGELCLVDHPGGGIYRLVPNPVTDRSSGFPTKLSESGLFSDVAKHKTAAGVIPYSVNSEWWNNGGIAERFVALPGNSTISTTTSPWRFPDDAVLVRTASMELEAGHPESRRRIETQILHFDGQSWGAYSYRWNDQQTDAELVAKGGDERILEIKDPETPGGKRQQAWRFHSRTECLRCHNSWCGTTLGFIPAQLNRQRTYHREGETSSGSANGTVGDQLRTLAHIRVLDRDLASEESPGLADPLDSKAGLTDRARAYLHANCSHCHREHAGGSVMMFMNYDLPLEKTLLMDAKPAQGGFGIPGARIVAPGDPCRSVLLYRISKLGAGHMPYLGSSTIDVNGTQLIYDWIRQLPAAPIADPHEHELVSKSQVDDSACLTALESSTKTEFNARLASVDRLLGSVRGAMALLRMINDGRLSPELKSAALARAIDHSDPLVRDLYQRFVPEEKRARLLGTDIKPDTILSLRGDAARGKAVFFQEGGVQCFTCHRINGQGRDFGPDLSLIGKKYSRALILENILEPSKSMDPKFVSSSVETTHGDLYTGFVVAKNPAELVLRTAIADAVRIPTADVARIEPQRLSLMPEQLLQSLTAQQAADLIEFLQSLR